MYRTAIKNLEEWLGMPERKPLILRGARQVGKTWLVRKLAQIANKKLIELNFEKQPSYTDIFKSNDPKQILLNLSAIFGETIDPTKCLLFLDEIQVSPELFAKLRWFAEDMPALPVIAAGSLLEFVLADHAFSMPVGRITYMHLEPMSFEEFLLAKDKGALYDYIKQFIFSIEIPSLIHEQIMHLFKEYILVGGLPAVVKSWVTSNSLSLVSQIQNDLLTTYREDFNKYKGRIEIEKLEEVMSAIPKMLGQKFVFSKVNPSIQSGAIKQILDLLTKAKIIYRVNSCSANGVPLSAEIRDKHFKETFLDTGLCCAMLGLDLRHLNNASDITLINNGALAEQIVGQMLRVNYPLYIAPILYYWHREEATSNAEIDYVIQHANRVVPIEVKSGSTGSLKSLHLFMGLKNLSIALRINSSLPSRTTVSLKNSLGNVVSYELCSLPFYLTNQIHRLLDS